VFAPDATIALDFALHRLAGVVEKLVVYPENMQANLDKLGGLVHSQRVLLALTQSGISREDAYGIVQRHAMDSWKTGDSFLARLQSDPVVTRKLKPKEIEALFDLGYHFKRVDTIFARVFGQRTQQPKRKA
jgi:adenylosuccinate lyase